MTFLQQPFPSLFLLWNDDRDFTTSPLNGCRKEPPIQAANVPMPIGDGMELLQFRRRQFA